MAPNEAIILIADIHANEAALRAVMQHARATYDQGQGLRIWFLGDLFGRGPEPVRAWQRLQGYSPEAIVVGNHDWMLIGQLGSIPNVHDVLYGQDDLQVLQSHREEFALLGMLALDATGQPVGGEVYTAVQAWPTLAQPLSGTYLVHGGACTPPNPTESSETILADMIVHGYIKTPEEASSTLTALALLADREQGSTEADPRPCLAVIGHYHRRTLYRTSWTKPWEEPVLLDHPYTLDIGPAQPALISPGSVGFPREVNASEPSYAVLGLEHGVPVRVTFHAVPYDRVQVRAAMEKRGYPSAIIGRL